MTLRELYEGVQIQSQLKVLSGRTGRVLAYNLDPTKHAHLDRKRVLDIWAELEITDSGFGNYCRPRMCCYVSDVDEDAAD